jgi:hypothetical protein
LNRPQRHVEGEVESLGGGGRDRVRRSRRERITNELDRLADHIGETCGKARMFQRLDGSSKRCQVVWCHPCQGQLPTKSNAAYHGGAMLSRQASKSRPRGIPVPANGSWSGRRHPPMAGHRGAPELHKFECGLQTRPRPGPSSPCPGRAKAKDLRPMDVNELSSWARGTLSMRISSMPN